MPLGALALAYIDPYNLEFLSFSIIERLAKLRYVDFAVHFSLMTQFDVLALAKRNELKVEGHRMRPYNRVRAGRWRQTFGCIHSGNGSRNRNGVEVFLIPCRYRHVLTEAVRTRVGRTGRRFTPA